MKGRAIVGTWVIGTRDGKPREVYLYQKTVAEETWRDWGLQAVGWQTGFNPVVGMELLATGAWSGSGVLGPEAFDAQPYLDVLDRWKIHWALEEREPGASKPT
jgi:saccharopine dehydrogenase-like NADP-dependent oxidoreductase